MAKLNVAFTTDHLSNMFSGTTIYTACLWEKFLQSGVVEVLGLDGRGLSGLISEENVARVAPGLISRSVKKISNVVPMRRHLNDKIHVVHGMSFATPRSDKRTVVTIHDLSPIDKRFSSPFYRKYFEVLIERAVVGEHEIIVLSNAVKRQLLAYASIKASKVHVTPLAPYLSNFRSSLSSADVPISQALRKEQYFVFFNHIGRRKNLELIIEAQRSCTGDDWPDYPVVIVGPVSPTQKQKLGAGIDEGKFELVGNLSRRHCADLLAGAKALLMPSINEGFGIPVLEAMRLGVPVICSDIPVFREITAGNAFYHDPHDASDLICVISRCLNMEKSELASVVHRAKKLSLEFSWDRCAHETISVYREQENSSYL